MRDARQLEGRVVQKLLVVRDVGHQHLDDVIGRARGGVTAHDLLGVSHGLLKLPHHVSAVAGEVDLGHHTLAQPHLFTVYQRRVAPDHAGFFKRLHALPAGRAGQAHHISQLLHGLA